MIQGIEILSQEPIMAGNTALAVTLCISIIVICVIVSVVLAVYTGEELWGLLAALGVFLGIVIGALTDCVFTVKPTGKYEYKVTIDDTVPLSEFYEKYEIIEQDGKIFTIREKEQQNEVHD